VLCDNGSPLAVTHNEAKLYLEPGSVEIQHLLTRERLHSALVKVLVVYLAVNYPGPSPFARPLSLIEVVQAGIITETADEMETRVRC